jgi:hypothetical protein
MTGAENAAPVYAQLSVVFKQVEGDAEMFFVCNF